MASSNNTLDSMRALGSISSGGVVPAAMHLAQRGAMAGYPAAVLQQQYLSSIPWLLRMQVPSPSLSHRCRHPALLQRGSLALLRLPCNNWGLCLL